MTHVFIRLSRWNKTTLPCTWPAMLHEPPLVREPSQRSLTFPSVKSTTHPLNGEGWLSVTRVSSFHFAPLPGCCRTGSSVDPISRFVVGFSGLVSALFLCYHTSWSERDSWVWERVSVDHPGAGDNALFIFLVYLPYRARACHQWENEHSLDGRESKDFRERWDEDAACGDSYFPTLLHHIFPHKSARN